MNIEFFSITIRLGEHEIKNDISPEHDCKDHVFYESCNKIYQDLEVEDVIIHPEYRPRPVQINDIALIRLKTKATIHGAYFPSLNFNFLSMFMTFYLLN